jgi:hypothetical protein
VAYGEVNDHRWGEHREQLYLVNGSSLSEVYLVAEVNKSTNRSSGGTQEGTVAAASQERERKEEGGADYRGGGGGTAVVGGQPVYCCGAGWGQQVGKMRRSQRPQEVG